MITRVPGATLRWKVRVEISRAECFGRLGVLMHRRG